MYTTKQKNKEIPFIFLFLCHCKNSIRGGYGPRYLGLRRRSSQISFVLFVSGYSPVFESRKIFSNAFHIIWQGEINQLKTTSRKYPEAKESHTYTADIQIPITVGGTTP